MEMTGKKIYFDSCVKREELEQVWVGLGKERTRWRRYIFFNGSSLPE